MAILKSTKTIAPLVVMLSLIATRADGDDKGAVWKQGQLNETAHGYHTEHRLLSIPNHFQIAEGVTR